MIPCLRAPRRRVHPRLAAVAPALALAALLLPATALAQETLLDTVPPDRRLVGEAVFSTDGKRVAYAATTAGGSVVVIDGRAGEVTPFADSPVFSPGGEHVAYRAGRRTSDTTEHWWIVLDGKKLATHDWVGPPAITARGSRVAYWAASGVKVGRAGPHEGGRYFVVFGKKKGPAYEDGDALSPPVISPDGKRVGYTARSGHGWVVVAGKHISPAYPLVGSPGFSADGRRFAYPVFDSARWFLTHGPKKRESAFDFVGRPVFAPRGKAVAHAAKTAGKWFVVLNGHPQPGRYDRVGSPVFSADGKHVAYRANLGGSPPGAGMVGLSGVMPEGENRVEGGKWFVVVGKTRTAESENVGDPVFSPDGEFVAHAARDGDKWRMVVGEAESRGFDHVSTPVFEADGRTLGFGARDGRKLLRVRMSVK